MTTAFTKTFGKGFDCFADNAVCNLGVADRHGREAIRESLRAFIDTGFTARWIGAVGPAAF